MRKTALLENAVCAKARKVDGTVFTVNGVKALETAYYTCSGELVRHFDWEGHYLTYAYGKWAQTKLWTGMISAWKTEETPRYAEAKREFLKDTGCYNVERFEDEISRRKSYKAKISKYERINARVAALTPDIPHGAISYIYSFVDKEKWCFKVKGKQIMWVCGECKNTFRRKFKAGQLVTCPCCHERVKTTIAGRKTSSEKITVLQEDNEGGILERQFKVSTHITPKISREHVTEEVRGFGDDIGWGWNEWYYGEYDDRYGEDQTWTLRKGMGSGIKCGADAFIYTGNLTELGVPERVIKTIEYEQSHGKKTPGSYRIRQLIEKPKLEYLIRSNYPCLIKDYEKHEAEADFEKNTLWEMFGMTKKQYKDLRTINANKTARKAYVMYGVPYKDVVLLNNMKASNADRIFHLSQHYALPVGHLCTLLKDRTTEELSRYDDYLNMAADRGENIHDEIIYRNKRWSEFHDRYVAEKEKEKAEVRIKEANKKYRNIKRDFRTNTALFGWENEKFEVLVPKAAGEIITEGRLQHHCVGTGDTYISRMDKRETFIVFLRKKEDPKKPFYTVEAEASGKIRQAYAAYDRKPEWETVDKTLKKWSKEVKKRSKRIGERI